MAPLSALTGLYAPQASARKGDGHTESQGGPVGPGFGVRDPQVPLAYWAGPPPNTQQMYAPGLLAGDPAPVAPIAGTEQLTDRTPGESRSHAAPYPRQVIPGGNTHDGGDQVTEQEARRAIKGTSLGGPEKVRTDPQGNIQPATWDYGGYVSPGETLLTETTDQLRSSGLGGSGTGKNRIGNVQGFGELGGHGSGAAHVRRANMIDPVPYNRQWLNSSDRPIMVPRRGYQASFDGPDSPYGALGDTTNDMQQGAENATVMTSPTPYNDPPNPAMGQAPAAAAPMVSDWF